MADDTAAPRFGAVEVIQIASKLTIDDDTFVIGGQATNLWAWFYRDRDAALRTDEPLTSEDLDYFGSLQAAQSLAAALGGVARPASLDDMNTPNTATVVAEFNGKPLVIDFLNGVLGVTRRELEHGVSIIRVEAQVDGVDYAAEIPVMHPVLCLKSRVANMLEPMIARRDRFAWRQLEAAKIIAGIHIDHALQDGDWDEVKRCLSEIFEYLRSDKFGKKVLTELGVDLLEILSRFEADDRIDSRYREQTLKQMISRIETDRSRDHTS